MYCTRRRRKGKRRVKNDSRVFGVNNWLHCGVISEVENLRGEGLVKQIQVGKSRAVLESVEFVMSIKHPSRIIK